MSDEEDSMSEGFSASEDEWKPGKDIKGGESSDDDDSDFEGSPLAGAASGGSGTSSGRKRGEPKARSAAKQTSSKKRTGLSLRAKLYNKYRPPPKTFSPPSTSVISKNSPSTSSSRTNSKNATAPNESRSIKRKNQDGEDSGSSSDSSIDNYLVNPEDLDIQSSFFNVEAKSVNKSSGTPVPVFDCNAGLENLSNSASENEEQEDKRKENKVFDFNNLLEYAKTLEHVKEAVAKHNAEESSKKDTAASNIDALDVYAVLALGEKQQNRSHNDGEDEDDEDDEEGADNKQRHCKNQPSKLSKTKSTRIKRHTKTRPTSTVADNDSDDSDWEEVADNSKAPLSHVSQNGNLEIYVDLPTRNKETKTKSQQDIELAFKRKLNRDIRERQVLLHKASLLCHFGRSYFYNRLLNDTILMNKALKLLPSKSSYPTEKGTEIKYFQSMVTWFKSVIKLKSQNLYPSKSACKTKAKTHVEILKQIESKEARCKQDMIFILIILLRAMGLQCRLIVNMQPLPLKPAACDLIALKSNKIDETGEKENNISISSKNESQVSNAKSDAKQKSSKVQIAKEDNLSKEEEKEKPIKTTSKNQKADAKVKRSDQKCLPEIAKEEIKHKKAKSSEIEASVEKKQGKENSKRNNEQSLKALKDIKTSSKSSSKTKELLKQNSNDSGSQNNKSGKNSNAKEDSHQKSNHTSNENSILHLKSQKVVESINKDNPVISGKEPSPETAPKELESSQKENKVTRLKRKKTAENGTKLCKPHSIESGSIIIPKIVVQNEKDCKELTTEPSTSRQTRSTRSRSKSPQAHVSTAFLFQNKHYKEKLPSIMQQNTNAKNQVVRSKSPTNKVKISKDFLKNTRQDNVQKRVLRSRQKTIETSDNDTNSIEVQIPQLDGANDGADDSAEKASKSVKKKQLKVKRNTENSDDDFEPSPPKKPKSAPELVKQDRRVLSSDDENNSEENTKRKQIAGDMWLEVWCDVEEQWVCVDIFKGKIHCIDTIRKSASPNMAYVFAFQNDLSIKDVTARYCHNWTSVIRKSRVDKAWLDAAISKYLGHRTKRDIKEDQELRRIHEEKPMPTSIAEYKNHPFFVLERHLLKFEALYPPNAPALGYVRGEPVYSRDCVHSLHSREIWLKQARTVKLGEKPYKIVKARPKWDRITQTVIKDQPLEIFGYWQTQDYEPPTAENGLVPRNAYGNVELFKPSMLPKKTAHIRLPGLNRICKKLGIDCANAVVGFDFHQGACHPTYDGFVVCEEFQDQVIAAWHQDQEEQDRKEQEKYEARVYGNWKKLIRGLLIRERLKLKYNF